MKKKIEKFTQFHGISGSEREVKKEFQKIFQNTAIIEDNLGSIATMIPRKKPKKNQFNIGIFAHMDEVGLLVQNILENGRIKINAIGGINPFNLVNQRVKIIKDNKELIGIILKSSKINDSKITLKDLEVDFGFADKNSALKEISLGDYINFSGEFIALQNNNYLAKACDNRIGCAIIEQLYEEYQDKELDFNLYLGATVQEEVGLKGAGTLLNALEVEFDQILIIDVSPIDNEQYKLGEGPLIRIAEPRGIYDYSGNNYLNLIASQNKIKVQDFISAGRTDGAAMQINKFGNKVNSICIPALNLHTANTIFNLKDVEQGYNLITSYLNNIEKIKE